MTTNDTYVICQCGTVLAITDYNMDSCNITVKEHVCVQRSSRQSKSALKGEEVLYEMIFGQAEVADKLRTMSNQELANLLLNYVWSDMDVTRPQTTLVGVVLDRLRKET